MLKPGPSFSVSMGVWMMCDDEVNVGGGKHPVQKTPPSPDTCLLFFSSCLILPQELHRRYEGAPDSAKTKALQTVIEMKASVCVSVYVSCIILISPQIQACICFSFID